MTVIDFSASFRKALVAIALPLLSGVAIADQLRAIRLLGTAEPGVPVSIAVDIDLADGSRSCGLDIDYGDGTVEEYLPGNSGPRDFPLKVKHTYPSVGNYIVKVMGKTKFRGLGTSFACTGSDLFATVPVTDESAKKAQAAALASKEREMAEKEANLERMAKTLEQAKQAQIAKENEFALKERRTRQQEVEVAAKEAALKAQSTQQAVPAKAMPPASPGKIDAF